MKITDNDTIIELALEFGDTLNAFDSNGNWKSEELRTECYNLVFKKHDVILKI